MAGRTIAVTVGSFNPPQNLNKTPSDALGISDQVSGAISSPGSKPTLSNTGPNPAVTLTTISGDYHTSPGETVTAKNITGVLYLDGANSGAVDCNVSGVSIASPGPANLFLTRVSCGGIFNGNGLNGLNINQCKLDAQDAVLTQIVDTSSSRATGYVMTNSYVRGRTSFTRSGESDPHWQATHWVGLSGFVITNNVFDYIPDDADGVKDITSYHHTAAVVFGPSWVSGAYCSGDFSGNWIYGGTTYQSYLSLVGSSTVNNNKFHSTYPDDTTPLPYGGPSAYRIDSDLTSPSFTASGNTYDGSPLSIVP